MSVNSLGVAVIFAGKPVIVAVTFTEFFSTHTELELNLAFVALKLTFPVKPFAVIVSVTVCPLVASLGPVKLKL